jgi:uncharacterized protein YndB with AHSA1/START domain
MGLQRVVRSSIIDAPIERVWSILRDFNSHDQWHSVVAESAIEDNQNSDRVGCVRNFTLADGNHIREMLISLSDKDYISTYTIVDATVPLMRYVATVSLKPVTDGNRTFWHWSSSFEAPPGMEAQLRDMVAMHAELPDLWDFAHGTWEACSGTSRFKPEGAESALVVPFTPETLAEMEKEFTGFTVVCANAFYTGSFGSLPAHFAAKN